MNLRKTLSVLATVLLILFFGCKSEKAYISDSTTPAAAIKQQSDSLSVVVSDSLISEIADSIIDNTLDSLITEVPDSLFSKPKPEQLSIMMMGDIMPGTLYPFDAGNAYLPKNDGINLFDNVTPILKRADFVAGNLEGTFADRSAKNDSAVNPNSEYVFMIPTRYTRIFKEAGFTALAVINNHANDLRGVGVKSTRKTLKEADIPYSGFSADGGYTLIDREGVVYAFCAFGTSPNGYHIDNIKTAQKIVTEADEKADIVIVSFHGGNEGSAARHVPKEKEMFREKYSRGDVYKFSRACVDAGADVVFGHSPHVCRGMEIYRDRIIAYSLGNFCTPFRMNVNGVAGYAPLLEAIVDINGKFINGRIHSFRQVRGNGPQPDSTNAAANEIRTLSIEDFPQTHPHITTTGEITPRH